MFVEKLSLFGFKSFNRKVSLEFGSGISSIIGPNGCGKSNVVDAIRWVLGEQSTKQLRGAKMEDVIFNGTRDEKPLSMAEVELTLNNDRGKLAIDFTTVSVARRLYRSGVSEYLINKKPVRLKDVRELFMDTGMGSHAYSVIERQMVDNILSDTTGHRRFLFEEAAGIMKYKTRKKEALSKLEATERDLLRVNDIITEVDRQVASLKRQVGKARRYRELMEEIRELDLANSQMRRREWMEQMSGLQARYDAAISQAEGGETEVASLDARLQELQLAVMEEEKALSEAREQLARVDDEIGQKNSRIMVLRERLEATHTRIREAGEHRVRLAERQERNLEAQKAGTDRLAELRGREERERQELHREEQALRTVESRLREMRETVAERKRATDGLRDQHVRAESAVESVSRRVDELRDRIQDREARAAALAREEQELAASIEVSGQNIAAAARRLEEIEEDARVLDMRRENHRTRTELHRKKMAENREQEAAARSRLTTLEDLQASYEGYESGVRALLLDETRDPSVVGTLGDLVKLPGEWSAALEPAMSGIWQYIVVTTTTQARHLLNRLREDAAGYATLVPLDRVPGTEAPEGDLTWASEVLETEEAYRPLVRHLLGGLALVKDLDTAMRVVREGQARRAATRTGQIVDAAAIAGGKGGPQGSELVEREEALDRCRKSVESLARSIAELTGHEAELREEDAGIENEARGLAEKLEEAVRARASLEKEEAALGVRLQHLREARDGVLEEKRGLEGQLEAARAESEALASRQLESRSASEDALRTLEALESDLNAVEAERETVLERVHGMRMTWAKLEAEVKDAVATGERLLVEEKDLASELERTAQDEEDAHRRVEEIERDLKDLARSVQELHVTRDRRSQVVAEREREKSEAAAREQQDADQLREVRRRASQARQVAHESELELHDIKGNLGHLEERLREEYEITPEELAAVEVRDLPEDAPAVLAEMKERIRRLGPVNLLAVEEFEEKSQRLEFMTTQRDDLVQAKDSLIRTIEQINKTASGMFLETFGQVQENFQKTFKVLFQGGECSLMLTGDDPLEADIDVTARPRGKKPQSIHQLSSGERALTAIALLFAIYLVKPSPFCILDEVDAPLDDANIDRFVNMLKEFSGRTQFIVITHNKRTMEAADCLYGITMQRPGVSSVVSVKLDGDRADGNGNGGGNGRKEEEGPFTPESLIAQ